MSVVHLDAEAVAGLLPPLAAVQALESVFAAEALPQTPQRHHLSTRHGDLLVMPSAGERGAGVKIVGVAPGNPDRGLPLILGMYVLLDAQTFAPLALIDGPALTGARTAAVSALATRHLARADAAHLVLFGAGAQARAHLAALRAVRPITRVTIVSRSPGPAEALAAEARADGLAAAVGTARAVAEADVVCTCTTSPDQVFDGALLAAGAHVNAVGAFRADLRELDSATLRRGRVVVETRDSALAENGDLLMPIAAGEFAPGDIAADLREVVAGAVVRRARDDVTVFTSVGAAFEDLAVAQAIHRAWTSRR